MLESKVETNPPHFAGFWHRVLAFGLDYLIITAYLIVTIAAGWLISTAFPNIQRALFSNAVTGEISGFLIITLPVTLYYALSEASSRQATWGKHRRGLKVIGHSQGRISLSRSLARSLLKFVPWELSHALIWQTTFADNPSSPAITGVIVLIWGLVGANIVSLWISPTRQTLYDRLAGTWVVWR
jgi:uncharacterized RDD family membrane protein YckC